MHAVATQLSRSHRRLAYAGLGDRARRRSSSPSTRARRWAGGPSSRSGSAPDVPLLLGAGSGLERGQLHPRAVPLYNLVHRFWGPLVLGAVALAAGLPAAWLVGALAWATHVAVDRAVGYGLRAPDGFQRLA